MDIGTDKLSAADRAQVPHHLIDIVPPSSTSFSAHSFAAHASAAIRDIAARGKLPMVVGGTGFFLRWLLYGRAAGGDEELPPTGADPALRAQLEREVAHFLDSFVGSRNEAWTQLCVIR